jgi:hypothetical protein
MQVQDSSESDEELDITTSSKTTIVCPSRKRKSLSIDAKKWLLNKRKRQQLEDEKLKRSLHLYN